MRSLAKQQAAEYHRPSCKICGRSCSANISVQTRVCGVCYYERQKRPRRAAGLAKEREALCKRIVEACRR